MNAPLLRRGWPAQSYDEAEFQRYLGLLSDDALHRLEQIVEELHDKARDADLVAIARELYQQDWARLTATLPPIPDELENFIPTDYLFSAWGPWNVGEALRLRHEAIQHARRRMSHFGSLPKRGAERLALRSGVPDHGDLETPLRRARSGVSKGSKR